MTKIDSVRAQFGQAIEGPTDYDDPKVRQKACFVHLLKMMFSAI